jgi:hypothetical protein
MTVRRTTGDDYVHLTEWQFSDAMAEVEIVNICARPSQVWLKPQTSFDVYLYGSDASGLVYPISSDIQWNIENPALTTVIPVDGHATLSSFLSSGSTSLVMVWKGLQQSIPVHVQNDFKPKTAPTRKVKVALVIIDPPIEAENGLRFHERFGWDDPLHLTEALRDSLNAAGGGAVDYQIVETYDEAILYAQLEGTTISVDSMYRLFLEPGWATFHHLEQTGGYAFDYNGLLAAHDFCTQSNSKAIDEIWVYSMPFTGMYESRLTGDGAFWYNSPPLDGNACTDQLPIMGFNYERGVAEAMHSFGHRVESAMAQTFGRWDYTATDKNDWEKFSSYDQVVPGEAYCGNIHFPPNGTSDYDYENAASVVVKAENWNQYPFMFDASTTTDCQAWGCSHLGFMSWWFRHLPHVTCKNKNGILNNWWTYIVDYNEGKALEAESTECACEYVGVTTSVKKNIDSLALKLFPNPGDGIFDVDLNTNLPHPAFLRVYNTFGVSIKSFDVDRDTRHLRIDIKDRPGGLYFLTLQNNQGTVLTSLSFTLLNE